MDFITFRINDLIRDEVERIRENEAIEYAKKERKIALGIQSTVETNTPQSFIAWRNAIHEELKKGF